MAQEQEKDRTVKRVLDFADQITGTPKKKQKKVILDNVDADALVKFFRDQAAKVQRGEDQPDLLKQLVDLFHPHERSFRSFHGKPAGEVFATFHLSRKLLSTDGVQPAAPSVTLTEICKRIDARVNMKLEVACRMLIDNILLEGLSNVQDTVCIFPELGITATVAADSGTLSLFGEPDYTLAQPAETIEEPDEEKWHKWLVTQLKGGEISAKKPYCVVVEAKRGEEIHKRMSQLVAEMVAAANGNPINGILTNGNVWRFLRLDGNTMSVSDDFNRENNLPLIVGILNIFLRGNGI